MCNSTVHINRSRTGRLLRLGAAGMLISCAVLAIQIPSTAQGTTELAVNPVEWEPIKIVRPDRAFLYPQRYLIRGYPVEGHATVMVEVGERGRLIDFVAVEASHIEFARAVERDLSRAQFLPARHHGEAVQARAVFRVNFRAEGVATSITLQEHLEVFMEEMGAFVPEPVLQLSTAERLDSPLERVDGEIPTLFVREGERPLTGSATVEFYIDRDGRVRLPRILSSDSKDVSESAFQTVRQWRFSPPRERANPRVVRVVMPFRITG